MIMPAPFSPALQCGEMIYVSGQVSMDASGTVIDPDGLVPQTHAVMGKIRNTALIQSVVGGIGFAVTGVPHAMLLTAIMFMLGVAQIGPAPVLLCGVIYLYWKGDSVWGTVMLVWFLLTTVLNNFVRPIFIRKGADLPLLLTLAGVLGGLFAFGIVGLFIGPVVLAVSYTLLVAWVRQSDEATPSEASGVELGGVRAAR